MQRLQSSVHELPIGAWVISGLGIVLGGLSALSLLAFHSFQYTTGPEFLNVGVQVIESLLLGCFSAVLIYSGYWLADSSFEVDRIWWVSLWTVIGLTGVIAVVGLVSSRLFVQGETLQEGTLVQMLLLAAGSGSLAGLLIGVAAVKQMVTAERAQQRRRALKFTNELLRHNILNGMQVILAASNQLKDHVDEDKKANLDRIQDRSRTIVDLVQNVRMLMKSTSGDLSLESVDLSAILSETIETADSTYERAQFESEIPPRICVRADPLLDAVFENLLANAVEHNDAERPRVEISVEEHADCVRVTIADDGPGIPDAKRTAYLEPGKQGEGSVGQGLGLYLVDTLVNRYGGEISIEDNEPSGTSVSVTLDRENLDESNG